jgi:hypothetical protein
MQGSGLTAILKVQPQSAASTERSTVMRISRIARRVASAVNDINYAQRRSMELFLGLGGNRHHTS